MKNLLRFVFLLVITSTAFAQNKKGIVASDLMKLATANQIQISSSQRCFTRV